MSRSIAASATFAIVPVKDFNRAKSRLHPTLDAAGRRSLARSNFDRMTSPPRNSVSAASSCSGSRSKETRPAVEARFCLLSHEDSRGSGSSKTARR